MPTPNTESSNSNQRFYVYLSSWKADRARAAKEVRDQKWAVLDWASAQAIQIADCFTEYGCKPYDAFTTRPEGRRLLATARRGDTIVAANFGRLFGAPEDAHAMLVFAREHGLDVCAIDIGEGKQGLQKIRALDTVLLAVSAAYSDYPRRVAARRVKKRQAVAGRYRGANPPFEYQVGPLGQLIMDPAKLKHIDALIQMRNKGTSLRALERFSKDAGFKISHAGIRKVLERAASQLISQN